MKKGQAYLCQSCGVRFSRWQGSCHACGEWDSLVLRPQESATAVRERRGGGSVGVGGGGFGGGKIARSAPASAAPFRPLGEETVALERVATGLQEVDRALGGGLVPGSVLLLGGDPGVGKSTLALQIAEALLARSHKETDKEVETAANLEVETTGKIPEQRSPAVYVSGEEDRAQLALRAKRLQKEGAKEGEENSLFESLLCTARTDIDPVLEWLREQPNGEQLLVVDSIQTMRTAGTEGSAAGSLTCLRMLTEVVTHFARQSGIAVLLIGHVTKEGQLAGPRQIEHMVDVVLYLEGERGQGFRLLRAVKNRFGALDEIGVFEMRGSGLRGVANPSSLFLSSNSSEAPGTAVFAGVEGTRPFLCEVQALVTPAPPGSPRRTALGWDSARLATLLAVLEAHADLRLSSHEVYLNISGGLRIKETACDLAVACAIISAARKTAIPAGWVFCGEIGLTGDIRAVGQTRLRATEAQKLGFAKMLLHQGAKHASKETREGDSAAEDASHRSVNNGKFSFQQVSRVSDLAPWLVRLVAASTSASAARAPDAAPAIVRAASSGR